MAVARRTRILIVDDSAVIRTLLRTVVSSDPSLEVAGTAADGASALNSLPTIRPDLILLDVEMPVMNGLVTLRELRKRGFKMPVIMCSSLTQRGAKVTIEALAGGASDYVTKPSGQASRESAIQTLSVELIPKIKALTANIAAASAPPRRVIPGTGAPPAGAAAPRPGSIYPMAQQQRVQPLSIQPTVLAIGVSTGGPAALDVVLPALPSSFPLPVLIVQHMPELFTKLFAERLNSRCHIPVYEASQGQTIVPGSVYIAKGNWHMEVVAGVLPSAPPSLHLTQGPPENHCRPAVDVLFRSIARYYGAGTLSLILTGMGSDGMLGCRVIREQGGGVLAQDEATSTVWGMPGAVTNAGLAHKVLPLEAIAPEIMRIISKANSEAHEPRRLVV
jgi:two-component system, chemotaxis family, protein-glutamate methylesterase/glutaminase